ATSPGVRHDPARHDATSRGVAARRHTGPRAVPVHVLGPVPVRAALPVPWPHRCRRDAAALLRAAGGRDEGKWGGGQVSVRAMSWVWNYSRSKPTQRLVLLAIADCANDHGAEAYPSNATLAAKT